MGIWKSRSGAVSSPRQAQLNRRYRQTIGATVLAILVAAIGSFPSDLPNAFQFIEVAAHAGVQARDLSGGPDKASLLDTVGHGAAWLDYDGDGWMDLFVVNGSTLARLKGQDKTAPPSFHLYRNRGDGTFSDETARAGVSGGGLWGMGVVVGDINNDGFPDLYVTGFGRNLLYRNRGNGTFQDITARSGVSGGGWSASAAFGDFDRDGFLDLYVARYVDLDINNFSTGCLYAGLRVACGPMGLKAHHDLLYHNNGDGTFKNETAAAGINVGEPYFGLGVIFLDYDLDGYPDIYVANDATPANLWHNNHDGTFTDRGTVSGCAYNADGREQARMGVDAGDYDRSGRQSIFSTNFSGETNSLFRNLGDGTFRDATEETGLGSPSIPYLGWGTKFADFDNDGWLDLFVVNGHIYPEVDAHSLSYTYNQRMLLFRNLGGRFQEVGREHGLAQAICARGAAFGDFDNDGDVDVFVIRIDELPLLLENRGGNRNHFLVIRLVGTRSNRDGFGARIRVTVEGTNRTVEARSGGSYLSASDPRLHFGLGQAAEAESVDIVWPSGAHDRLDHVRADRWITVTEGKGMTSMSEARK